jgi:hypothetical protein
MTETAGRWFYANEKLSRAMRLLIVSPGDVRSRLLCAYMEFHPLREADFPPELQQDYRWVMEQLTKRGPVLNHKGEISRGSVENTLSRMRKKLGSEVAERLLKLHDGIEEAVRKATQR